MSDPANDGLGACATSLWYIAAILAGVWIGSCLPPTGEGGPKAAEKWTRYEKLEVDGHGFISFRTGTGSCTLHHPDCPKCKPEKQP